jgi:hypothetical protein
MKRLLLISILLLCTTVLSAQVGIGPEAGIGMSTMYFSPVRGFTNSSSSSLLSWRAGAVVDVRLNKNIYLQSGLRFATKGQSRKFSFYFSDSLNEAVEQTLTLNYIELPIAIIYKTGQQGKGRFFAGLGSSPSYLLGGRNKLQANGKYNDTAFATSFNRKIIAGNPVAQFDIGLEISAGYELATGLFFKAYYTVGMRDIGLGDEIDKNRIWGIAAGYFFGKGRNINQEADDLIDRTK